MNTFVVWGSGRMGVASGAYLLKRDHRVVFVDSDARQLEQTKTKIEALSLDSRACYVWAETHRDMREICKRLNVPTGSVLLACCGYNQYVNLTIECISLGLHMVDLGGNTDVTTQQKSFSTYGSSIIIPDLGLAPGLVNILGMSVFKMLHNIDATDIDIKMLCGGLPQNPGCLDLNPLQHSLNWSANGLVNEYEIPSREIVCGREVLTPALTVEENILFEIDPEDQRRFDEHTIRCFSDKVNVALEAFTTGGGTGSLPSLLKDRASVKTVVYRTLRYEGHLQALRVVKQMGLFDDREELVKLFDERMPKNTNDVVFVLVNGLGTTKTSDGSQHKHTIERYKLVCFQNDEFSAMAQTTGFSAAIVAELISDNELNNNAPGCYSAELTVPAHVFIERLKQCGINIFHDSKTVSF